MAPSYIEYEGRNGQGRGTVRVNPARGDSIPFFAPVDIHVECNETDLETQVEFKGPEKVVEARKFSSEGDRQGIVQDTSRKLHVTGNERLEITSRFHDARIRVQHRPAKMRYGG